MNALSADFVAVAGKDDAQLWRGQCLNLFARGENAVTETLLQGHDNGHEVALRHLSGQRISDLEKLAASVTATPKQASALNSALIEWKEIQSRRPFLAHGVSRIAYEADGAWIVLLDVVAFRSGEALVERWTVRRSEATDFHADLRKAFKTLTSQLGHLRTRLVKL